MRRRPTQPDDGTTIVGLIGLAIAGLMILKHLMGA